MSFSFGAPSSAPASSGLTGFSFGANKPATPGFGLTATSQPSTGLFGSTPATSTPSFGGGAFGSTTPAFGATSTTPAFGAAQTSAFGAASTPAFGAASTPAFGATATPAFGATTTPAFGATTTPAFGAAATPAFGAAQTPAFGATTTPAFGATATPAFGATTTPAFGATTTPVFGATTTPTFGATSTPAFGAASAAPAFGTTPAFGATTTPAFGASAAPAFGATTAPTFGSTGLGTGLNFGAGTSTSTAATGLSFGATTTTSTGLGGLSSFSFGGATSAQSTGFAPFGASGTSTTTTSLFGNKIGTTSVTGTQLSTSATPSLGLGGLAPTSGVTGGAVDSKSEPPKQAKLPNEISTTVESFKEFVKKQKAMSSEVMRISVKPLHKVSRDAEAMLRQAVTASGAVGRARAQSRRLRACAAAALAAADAVNRDAALPGSELEGSPPPPYVKDLIAELEQQLITFRRQMDVADKQLQSAPKLLTEQELTLGIRRMYESLVALAGRLQAVHSQVEGQKEQYLNLRKYILKDPTNVFDTPHPNTSLDQILRDVDDPRKRMKSNTLDLSQSSAVLTDPRAVLGNIQQLAGPTPFSYVASSLSPFPTTDTSGPNWQPQVQPNFNTSLNISSFGAAPSTETNTFQLQKPPGKRGKQ